MGLVPLVFWLIVAVVFGTIALAVVLELVDVRRPSSRR